MRELNAYYSCEDIRIACEVLRALSEGVPITPGEEEPTDEVIAEAQEASLSALRIIRTGLREIEQEHSRANSQSS